MNKKTDNILIIAAILLFIFAVLAFAFSTEAAGPAPASSPSPPAATGTPEPADVQCRKDYIAEFLLKQTELEANRIDRLEKEVSVLTTEIDNLTLEQQSSLDELHATETTPAEVGEGQPPAEAEKERQDSIAATKTDIRQRTAKIAVREQRRTQAMKELATANSRMDDMERRLADLGRSEH